jgi:pilus assembly protein Flp/PilA
MLTYAYVVVMNYLASFENEEGQGMVEYALIIALIAVLLIGALGSVKGGVQGSFDAIVTGLGGSTTTTP